MLTQVSLSSTRQYPTSEIAYYICVRVFRGLLQDTLYISFPWHPCELTLLQTMIEMKAAGQHTWLLVSYKIVALVGVVQDVVSSRKLLLVSYKIVALVGVVQDVVSCC